jgi:ABC-type Fe3+-hydroxamate transport system substrate-binding protein
VVDLRHEKSLLQERFAQRDELIAYMQQEIVLLRERVHALQEQLKKGGSGKGVAWPSCFTCFLAYLNSYPCQL